VEILFILLLIVANGILAMSETAVVSARKVRLQHRANEGDRDSEPPGGHDLREVDVAPGTLEQVVLLGRLVTGNQVRDGGTEKLASLG
jgi:Mg2+/Co2+ transporter CorB